MCTYIFCWYTLTLMFEVATSSFYNFVFYHFCVLTLFIKSSPMGYESVFNISVSCGCLNVGFGWLIPNTWLLSFYQQNPNRCQILVTLFFIIVPLAVMDICILFPPATWLVVGEDILARFLNNLDWFWHSRQVSC